MTTASEKRHSTQHLASIKEIAAFFCVSRRTVKSWIARGAPLCFVGKCWQGNAGEIWQWLKDQEAAKMRQV